MFDVLMHKELRIMTKKKKADPAPPPPVPPTPEGASEALRSMTVRVSEANVAMIQASFAEGRPAQVTVHPPTKRSDSQRAYRKTYRQRPDVRERMKAYRTARRKRLREALAAKAETTRSAESASEAG